MCAKHQKLLVGVIFLAVMSLGCEGQAQNLTTRTTGCLGSGGNFSLFALGDAPLQGCPAGENQVSLKLDDLSDGAATVPFFVTLRFGEEQVIAQNGALELRARCILGSGSGDSLQLVFRSALDGWLATSAGSSTTTQNLAGDEIVLFTAVGRPDQGRLSGFGEGRLTGAQLGLGAQVALAPDGSFLSVSPGSTALGVDLFDQDCLAVGTASLIRGVLPGPPTLGQPLQGGPANTSGAVATGSQIVGTVGGDGISVGVTIGNTTSGTPTTGMSPIDGGIVPSLGSGVSSIAGPTPLSDGGIPSLGGSISAIGGPTPLSDGGIPSLGGGISSIGGPTPLSDGGIPSLGGGISSIGR